MRAIFCLVVAALGAGCFANTENMLKDVSYGQDTEMSVEQARARTKMILRRDFPAGLDPDRTDEDANDFWTVWNHKRSVLYRGTKRLRARVVIQEAEEENRVRIGVAVVSQINDNIDNPDNIDEARWVRKSREPEMERDLEEAIARRYIKVEPSKTWKEKNRTTKRKGLRQDLLDRAGDVDLDDEDGPGDLNDDDK